MGLRSFPVSGHSVSHLAIRAPTAENIPMTSDSGCSLSHHITQLCVHSKNIKKISLRKINRPYSSTGSHVQHSSGFLYRRGVQFPFEEDTIDVMALAQRSAIS
jgi:hypothetical protein